MTTVNRSKSRPSSFQKDSRVFDTVEAQEMLARGRGRGGGGFNKLYWCQIDFALCLSPAAPGLSVRN